MSDTQEKKLENVGIGRCALFGAVGFGVGGLIGEALVGVAGSSSLLGVPIMGAIGGATLGLALRRKVATLALVGAIGFLAGPLAGMFVWGFAGGKDLAGVLFLAVTGMIGGAALGLALRNRREIIGLALAGALGFGISGIFLYTTHLDLTPWLGFVLMGIIGGAFLGATLGYLEKEKAGNQSTPSPARP